MKKHELLSVAAEQFLGKELREVHYTVLQTLEGHLRAILGTLTIEEIFQDREAFAQQVREVASPDVGKMGIEILSFTIKDVYDTVDYLASLGKSQTAAVIRDADITVAFGAEPGLAIESRCQNLCGIQPPGLANPCLRPPESLSLKFAQHRLRWPPSLELLAQRPIRWTRLPEKNWLSRRRGRPQSERGPAASLLGSKRSCSDRGWSASPRCHWQGQEPGRHVAGGFLHM